MPTPHTGWGAYSQTDDFAHSDAVNFAAQTGEFFITGIQLEVGEQATAFEHRSVGDELARCQRYYYTTGADYGHGVFNANSYGHASFPVTMRADPSITFLAGTSTTPTSVTINPTGFYAYSTATQGMQFNANAEL